MRVVITLRDMPDGHVDISFKQHGGRRTGGVGAEGMANSILHAMKVAQGVRARPDGGDGCPEEHGRAQPPVAEAAHE